MCWAEMAFAAAAASSTLTVVTGQKQAAAQEANQAQALAAEQQRAQAEVQALRQKEAQDKEAQARDAQRIMAQSKKAISTARVSALESGAAMSNINMVLSDFERQELGYIEGVQRQGEITSLQYNIAVDNAMKQSVSNQININQPVSAPSFLEIPMKIAASKVDYEKNKKLIE